MLCAPLQSVFCGEIKQHPHPLNCKKKCGWQQRKLKYSLRRSLFSDMIKCPDGRNIWEGFYLFCYISIFGGNPETHTCLVCPCFRVPFFLPPWIQKGSLHLTFLSVSEHHNHHHHRSQPSVKKSRCPSALPDCAPSPHCVNHCVTHVVCCLLPHCASEMIRFFPVDQPRNQ